VTVIEYGVADGVGRILLNRPEQMNAITVELGEQLEAALRDLGARSDVNVILVRGAGGNFSAGGDFGEVERLRAGGPGALLPLFVNFGRACAAIAEIDPPVIAAVEGVAMAGGCELMLAADIALVRDDAKIADSHVNYGQIPGGGSSQRLPRLIGRQGALGLLLGGERLSGRDAVSLGLAHRSFAPGEFDQQVEAFVTKMASRRRDALAGIKRLVYMGLATTLDAGLALELDRVVAHIAGDAGRAGVDAFATREGSA
jgi:enoyl-CoA hydratase/carnithine racemase